APASGKKTSSDASSSGHSPVGGISPELETKAEEADQLPPGIDESGEVVDMAVYEAWQAEQEVNVQQKMQRREEVNINVHRGRGEDEPEPGDDF
ncbi:conjugal transfer protein TraD, partial [Salmonella enterica]|nr:conjugal transfer protein TraD [Salmonella enterica]EBP3183863.1 conjugal transfer protein TraD [Salmonella enterica]ECO1514585.1 conjugal transfer protein TraD [Salmonella enterica subsp. arizonae]EHF7634869.1 conjugal transfer protein TraD [Salmonella enterica]